MKQRFDGATLGDRQALLRRYGMGVADLVRATRSATDALTLVARTRSTHSMVRANPRNASPRASRGRRRSWRRSAGRGTTCELRSPTSSSPIPAPAGGRAGTAMPRTVSDSVSVGQPRPLRNSASGSISAPSPKRRSGRRATESDATNGISAPTIALRLRPCDIWRGTAADLAQRGAVAVLPGNRLVEGATVSRSQRARWSVRTRRFDRDTGSGRRHLDPGCQQEDRRSDRNLSA